MRKKAAVIQVPDPLEVSCPVSTRMQERYEPAAVEAAAQRYWAEHRSFAAKEDPAKGKILLPVHVPVSERAAAHGARAQLHDRRRDRALHAHARPERVAADGVGRVRPACRKRRDEKRRRAGALDLRQHRAYEDAAAVARLRARLGARACDLPTRVLPLESVVLPAPPGEGPRLQEDGSRQLGSGRSDRARERAGNRRARLAHGRAHRKARDPDVLPQHHALLGRAARGDSIASPNGRNA